MTDAVATKAARLAELGQGEDIVFDGTMRGVGVCRSCHRKVALVRLVFCPLCGSSRGVVESGP